MILHAVLAVSIFFLFISSWWMLGLPLASAEFRFREIPFQLHKNIGITLVAVELPYSGHENEELNQLYSDIHLWTCWILLAVVAAHVSGALYHAFRNDGVVRRMLHL